MKIIMVIVLILFMVNIAYSEVSHEVLLEKLNNMSVGIDDVKKSIETKIIKRDKERDDQVATNKEVYSDIQAVQLLQTEQGVKINIIWGILGTAIGGGGVYTGTRFVARKRNGNGNGKEVK